LFFATIARATAFRSAMFMRDSSRVGLRDNLRQG
jgi:hypothetical protein